VKDTVWVVSRTARAVPLYEAVADRRSVEKLPRFLGLTFGRFSDFPVPLVRARWGQGERISFSATRSKKQKDLLRAGALRRAGDRDRTCMAWFGREQAKLLVLPLRRL
jgi:hypothetical protein